MNKTKFKRSISLLAIFLITLIQKTHAQVTYDNNALCNNSTTDTGQLSVIISNFSVPVGNQKVLVVLSKSSQADTISSLTFNGSSFSRLGNVISNANARAEIWYLVLGNVTTGITSNITATYSDTNIYMALSAASFSGVNQSVPLNNLTNHVFASGATSSSLSITGAVGDLAIEAISSLSEDPPLTLTPTSGQSVITSCTSAPVASYYPFMQSAAYIEQTGSSQTLSWAMTNTTSSYTTGIHIAANIQRAPIALPIHLLQFTAQRVDATHNLIKWSDGEEDPNTSFTIERSNDGRSFSSIGNMNGKGSNSTYAFSDNQPQTGTLYYRLKINEPSGNITYSGIATIQMYSSGGSITISPVPATNSVNIVSTDENLIGQTAIVYNFQGAVIAHVQLTANQNVNISNWTSGIYGLRLPSGEVLRLVKD